MDGTVVSYYIVADFGAFRLSSGEEGGEGGLRSFCKFVGYLPSSFSTRKVVSMKVVLVFLIHPKCRFLLSFVVIRKRRK